MKIEIQPTGELLRKGEKLLEAAFDYWEEYQAAGNHGAVVWLQGDDGFFIAFTRGEYREELKRVIDGLL